VSFIFFSAFTQFPTPFYGFRSFRFFYYYYWLRLVPVFLFFFFPFFFRFLLIRKISVSSTNRTSPKLFFWCSTCYHELGKCIPRLFFLSFLSFSFLFHRFVFLLRLIVVLNYLLKWKEEMHRCVSDLFIFNSKRKNI
jgi:hypothetical protein